MGVPDQRIFQLMTKGDMKDHVLVLYGIALGMRAKTILEIGVRRGTSSLAWAMAARETGGVVYAVDVDGCLVARGAIERFGLIPWWKFKQADSMEFWKGWSLPLDILFIDGDHRLPAVKNDFENYSRFVRKDGLILMHDAFCDEATIIGERVEVHKYIPIIRQKPKQFELVTLPYCYGLTIIRKLQ